MTKDDIISRIIKLELEITSRIIKDRSFKPTINDEYHNYRIELTKLRKKLTKLNSK